MKYKLLKDLLGMKAGSVIDLGAFGTGNEPADFFEPIPDTPKKLKTVWDLENKDFYWFILEGTVLRGYWTSSDADITRREVGDVFITEEEARQELAYRKAKSCILKHHAENSGFVPCWTDGLEKFSIYYVHPHGTVEKGVIGICPSEWHQEQVLCYFASREEAHQSIKDCEKEWKIIFNVTL